MPAGSKYAPIFCKVPKRKPTLTPSSRASSLSRVWIVAPLPDLSENRGRVFAASLSAALCRFGPRPYGVFDILQLRLARHA